MSDRDDDRDDRPIPAPRSQDEPEPDWAEEIRRLRRARGDRLRKVFSGFDDEQEER